jgi:mRNA interferase RelE/StbE
VGYSVFWKNGTCRSAAKKFPAAVQELLAEVITCLQDQPKPDGSTKLKGGGGAYRVYVGADHRLIYEVDDTAKMVTLVTFGDRKNVYRKR